MPPQEYLKLLLKEMHQKSSSVGPRPIDTLYFGGGTPSLLEPSLISLIINNLKDLGFELKSNAEVTLEINPATIDAAKMSAYLEMGFNRFSVGAQTFKDEQLRQLGREHNAQQTHVTLELLRNWQVNFSFDLLFALPNQSLADLERDLDIVAEFTPHHVSPYCLTVPEQHKLSRNRPSEEHQVEMFDQIHERLVQLGYYRYEISNYARPGYESRHNTIYWNDSEYWGLGLSAHSYLHRGPWGLRFWNLNQIERYEHQVVSLGDRVLIPGHLNANQFEQLQLHQALTDFCHTSLRMQKGFSQVAFQKKFPNGLWQKVEGQLQQLLDDELLERTEEGFRLSPQGVVLSNQVFQQLTYLQSEVQDLTFS